jgi:hypothetical protein
MTQEPELPALPAFAWAWVPSEVWKDWIVTTDKERADEARKFSKVVTLVRESEAIAAVLTEREKSDVMRAALDKIDIKAEAGLCYFTLESARAFLKDIRGLVSTIRTPPPKEQT